MAHTLKIGDKVRISNPEAPDYGDEGEIVEIDGAFVVVVVRSSEPPRRHLRLDEVEAV